MKAILCPSILFTCSSCGLCLEINRYIVRGCTERILSTQNKASCADQQTNVGNFDVWGVLGTKKTHVSVQTVKLRQQYQRFSASTESLIFINKHTTNYIRKSLYYMARSKNGQDEPNPGL